MFILVILMVYLGVFSGDYVGLWLVIVVINLLPRFSKRRMRYMVMVRWMVFDVYTSSPANVFLRLWCVLISQVVANVVLVECSVSRSPPSLLMGYGVLDTSGSNLRPWSLWRFGLNQW